MINDQGPRDGVHVPTQPWNDIVVLSSYAIELESLSFGVRETRTYRSVIRHWFVCRIVMYFPVTETPEAQGEMRRSR